MPEIVHRGKFPVDTADTIMINCRGRLYRHQILYGKQGAGYVIQANQSRYNRAGDREVARGELSCHP